MKNTTYEDIFSSAVIGVLKAQQQGFIFMWKTTNYLIAWYILPEIYCDYKDSLLIKPTKKAYKNLQRYLNQIDRQRVNIGEELSIKKHLEIGIYCDSGIQEAYGIVTGIEQMDEEFLNNMPDDPGIDRLIEMENAWELVHNVIFKSLSDRELEVIKQRFGFYGKEYSLKEIGEKLPNSISKERVRQIQEHAFARIRGELEN